MKYYLIKIIPNYNSNPNCYFDQSNYKLAVKSKKNYLPYLRFEKELIDILFHFFKQIKITKIAYTDQQSPFGLQDLESELEEFDVDKFRIYIELIFRYSLAINIRTDKTQSIIFDKVFGEIHIYTDQKIVVDERLDNLVYHEIREIENVNFENIR